MERQRLVDGFGFEYHGHPKSLDGKWYYENRGIRYALFPIPAQDEFREHVEEEIRKVVL